MSRTPAGGLSLAKLCELMTACGAQRILAKILAPNDNSKNQVYLGQGFEALNVFPNLQIRAVPDRPHFTAALSFIWLDESGTKERASGAQLILYPQYPEVRLSGFLEGTKRAPSFLMRSRDKGRVLVMGVTPDGRVFAHAAAAASELAGGVNAFEATRRVGVFIEIPLSGRTEGDTRGRLLSELRRIHRLGWVRSKRLRSDGSVGSCESPNCGGYTLEAELGIRPSGFSEPDFLGWELKQHAVASFERPPSGAITLFTPEPTGGYYRSAGPTNFIERFGYPDKKGRPNRRNFGGIHRASARHTGTGLLLTLRGYSPSTGKIVDPSGAIALVLDSGEVAASWAFSSLMQHWNRKHAQAAFVPSLMRKEPQLAYRYGRRVQLAAGTDFLLLLKAIDAGSVYYDPGLKLVPTEVLKVKRRNQFRIRATSIGCLYRSLETVDLA